MSTFPVVAGGRRELLGRDVLYELLHGVIRLVDGGLALNVPMRLKPPGVEEAVLGL